MSNKAFIGLISLLVIGTIVVIFVKKGQQPKAAAIGVSHPSQGGNHIAGGQPHVAYNSDPPSSGPHYADSSSPTPWGVYLQQVPAEVFLHNEEHGGVVVSYKPDLPTDQIKKLQALFAPPYSNKNFIPSKAIVTPRSKDTHAIELASWTETLNLDQYDETKLMDFYLQHVSHSPEATGGPYNTPLNQARGQ